MSASFLHRTCPVCHAADSVEAVVCSEPCAETLPFENLIGHWNGFFKDKIFFSYTRCSGCGLLFAPVFFDRAQLQALYGQMPPNMDVVPLAALRATQRGYYEALARHKPGHGGFLEVGPDIGLFTENCTGEGRFSDFWLFEPNVNVHPQLAEVVKGHSFHIVEDMFGFSQVPDRSISAAVLVHVLDHLLDPVVTLSEIKEKMRPDGKLLVVTHNEGSLLPRVIGARWPAYCLQHPQLYDFHSMKNLMQKAGFSVDEQSRTVNHFPVSFLTRHALWALGLKVNKVPSFGGLTLGLKLGNMLTVATPT